MFLGIQGQTEDSDFKKPASSRKQGGIEVEEKLAKLGR